MVAIQSDITVFLTQNAMLWIGVLDQLPDCCFRSLIALGDRVITAILLVGDGNAGAEARQRLSAGNIGKFEEEIPVGQHENLIP